MHNLIQIEELDKLTDQELLDLEACLRDIILTCELGDEDLRRCLITLSNAVYVRQLRLRGTTCTALAAIRAHCHPAGGQRTMCWIFPPGTRDE